MDRETGVFRQNRGLTGSHSKIPQYGSAGMDRDWRLSTK